MTQSLSLIILCFLSSWLGTAVEKEYPVPEKTDNRLFYIQRNHNCNTIVYDARFDHKGNLEKDNPIDVYWIRYQEQGQRMELRKIEKMFAFGVECSQVSDKPNHFNVELVAQKNRPFTLVQKAPYRVEIITLINKKESQLEHMYIYADNSGYWPKVKYVELFGSEVKTGKPIYERFWNE